MTRIEKQVAKAEAEMNAAAARLDKAQAQYDAAQLVYNAFQKLAEAHSDKPFRLSPQVDAPVTGIGVSNAKPNGGRGTLEEQAKAGRKVLVENAE